VGAGRRTDHRCAARSTGQFRSPMSFPLTIETARLSLRPAGEAWLSAIIAGAGSFSLMTGFRVADGCCCEMPDALRWSLDRVRRAPRQELRWWAPMFFVERIAGLVVGIGGYKGPPQQNMVELGYSIAPSQRRRGLATEATAALAKVALQQPGVERVLAHTLPEPGPSPRVLEKSGFTRTGDVMDPEDGLVWRWELPRSVSSSA
jgi:[ribosomal protein S5]-alanine N-acetyltransferase